MKFTKFCQREETSMSSSWEGAKFPPCPKTHYNKSLGHILIICLFWGEGDIGSFHISILSSCHLLPTSGTWFHD